MIDYVEDGKFYLCARGEQIKALPDIALVLKPILDTSLHAFAVEGWTFTAKHSGGWKAPFRSPKVVLRHDSTHCVISFRIGPLARFNNQFDVCHALRGWAGALQFKSVGMTVQKPPQIDELEMLQKFNAERFERISKNRPVRHTAAAFAAVLGDGDIADVIDFAEYRARQTIKPTALAIKGVFAQLR